MNKLVITLLLALTIFASCDKDPDNNNPGNTSRTIRYEVTGNFTGTFTAAYTPASGGVTNDQVTSLPWSKEVTYAAGVSGASIGVTGGGGVPGQKVTLVIKRGGSQVGASIEQTVNSSGVFSIAGQPIVF